MYLSIYLFAIMTEYFFSLRAVGIYRQVHRVLDYILIFQSFFFFQKCKFLQTTQETPVWKHVPAPTFSWPITKQIRYLEESAGVVLFQDFQAVLHHAGGLTELHGAVGDLVAHHLTTDHTGGYYGFKSGAFERLWGEVGLEPAGFPPLQNQILSASPALSRWRQTRLWWMSQQFAKG